MGRDIKVGLDYFPIYHDFFQNKKIKALRRAHGPIGLLTYLNILCRVYDHGYYYRFDSIAELAQDIAEEIASEQLRKVAARVTESIHYLVEHQILAEEFFKQDVLTGVTMQEQYIKSMYRMKRKLKMDTYLLVDVLEVLEKIKENSEQIGFSSEQIGFSSEESTQSKSKSKSESKSENEIEKNFLFETTTTTACACEGEQETPEGVEKSETVENAPSLYGVLQYFKSLFLRYDSDGLQRYENFMPLDEARKFIAYNEKRGWDCMPDWKTSANLWLARLNDRKM